MSNRPTEHNDDSLMHRALVAANNMQRVPNLLIAAALIAASAAASLSWLDQGAALFAALGALTASAICWLLLWLLPRRGKSYGAEKATVLIVSAGIALVTAILGVFNLDVLFAQFPLALIVAATYYATWIEPFRLGVTHEHLRAAGWHTPINVLHIGDIHVERITDRERKLNRLIHLLKPDLIVFTGDFVNLSYTYDARAQADIREIISAWRAPLGVYCVPGTPAVEPLERVRTFVAGMDNLTLLLNQWHTVETPSGDLHILGVITTHDLPTDRAALHDALQAAPPAHAASSGGLRLLLAHSPDIAPEAAEAGIDWMLSGHTHGGQIRLPLIGALVSASHWGMRFVMGRYTVGKMTLYVSRGVGMEGYGAPRARVLCPPEVIFWRVS